MSLSVGLWKALLASWRMLALAPWLSSAGTAIASLGGRGVALMKKCWFFLWGRRGVSGAGVARQDLQGSDRSFIFDSKP